MSIKRFLDYKSPVYKLFLHIGIIFPDWLYVNIQYFFYFGKFPNLKSPITFNEKLQWLKLYNRRPMYTTLVDKIEVKKWVKKILGEKYVIPTYGVWTHPREIEFEKLPKEYVIKCNHSGGNCGIHIVKDGANVDTQLIKKNLSKALRHSIYKYFREWPYKNVKKRILAEKYLGENISDYKFFCYDGFVESVMVCTDRESGHPKFYFFDEKWNLKRYNIRGKNAAPDFTLPPPKNIEKMFEIASILSKGFPFVRVDLYNIDGRIYFGEITFYPASGLDNNLLLETDILFGNYIKLPLNENNRIRSKS